ncbi:hypothetical protein BDW22DRAFT_1431378 [Trametopsis cervina]|nr:hypothetical protein BDW22DRAFT_1431378 [Trametopsis cervina]
MDADIVIANVASSDDSPSAPTRTFVPPFDDADADLIVRSSDGFYFQVYKVILAKASEVFKDMFAVPQPGQQGTEGEDAEIPVVALAEDGKTLDRLLHLCYPISDPESYTLSDIGHLQVICDKYGMEGITKNLERPLRGYLDSSPLRVYAIACRGKYSKTANEAAQRCLSKPMSYILEPDVPEFSDLSVTAYRALPSYHNRCAKVVSRLAASNCEPWVTDLSFCWFRCNTCPPADTKMVTMRCQMIMVQPRRWWRQYMDQVSLALLEKPVPESIADVHIPTKVDCRGPCGRAFAKDIARFNTLLEDQIRGTTRGVEFKI